MKKFRDTEYCHAHVNIPYFFENYTFRIFFQQICQLILLNFRDKFEIIV